MDRLILLDRFLPQFDVRTHHSIRIGATPQRVYGCLQTADFDAWGLSRLFYAARTLPALPRHPQETWRCLRAALRRPHFALDDLLAGGFTVLAQQVDEELVLGTVGRFWLPHGELHATSPADFTRAIPAGSAKAAWNFTVAPSSNGTTELRTETRVLCADAATRRHFAAYWMVIRPFSGLIRREMLAAIKNAAQRLPAQPPGGSGAQLLRR